MLLNGRLELHGADAEGLARKALDDALRGRSIRLRPHEHEDAVAFLVAECWRLSLDYDPARTPSFSTYAYRRLRLLVWEWHRREYARTKWKFGDGRIHERPRPDLLSLDADDAGRGRLDTALGTRTGDPQNDRDPDLSRLLTGGSRQVARDHELLGFEAPERAA